MPPDTRLAVYQGAAVGALSLVERNDDATLGEPRSRVVIDATSGQTYRIQLGDAPGQAAGPRLLRWYASPPDPITLCDPLPGNFVTNPSLETDAAGWGLNAAAIAASDLFQRYIGDGVAGGASAEAALAGGAGEGIAYTDTATHDFTQATTVSLWVKAAGGTPHPVTVTAKAGGTVLAPSGGTPTITPTGAWQQISVLFGPLPGVSGSLHVEIALAGAGAAMVLRVDCLQAIVTVVAPATPTGLTCAPADTAIRFAWSAVPGADGYYVRVNGGTATLVTTTEVVLTGLTPDTDYTLSVAAFSTAGGESSQASLVCHTHPSPSTETVSPSCDALGFLELNGSEVFNLERTRAYMTAGLMGAGWSVTGGTCQILARELGLPARAPAIDPAPWYDSARPESGDFLGAWPRLKITRHTSRSITSRISGLGGGVFGRQVYEPAEISVTATLLARSDAGMEYGRAWLEKVLRAPLNDPCSVGVARVRLACPPDDGSNDALGEWLLYDVALASAIDDGQVGTTADKCCSWLDVAFTLTAGNPLLYKVPSTCVAATVNPDPGHCVDLCSWLIGPADGSYATSVACHFAAPHIVGEVAPIVTLAATGGELVGVTVDLYGEAVASCPPPPTAVPQLRVSIPHLPAGSVLVLDNARQTLTWYPSTSDASAGTNAQSGVPYIALADGQTMDWLVSEPENPSGCVVVGKRTLCGASGSVLVQTQLRQA